MSNMSYCRFQNTALDLQDCLRHIEDPLDSRDEVVARERIWNMAKDLMEAYPDGLKEFDAIEEGDDE